MIISTIPFNLLFMTYMNTVIEDILMIGLIAVLITWSVQIIKNVYMRGTSFQGPAATAILCRKAESIMVKTEI